MAINRLLQGSLQSGLPKFDSVWDGVSAVGSMEVISAITLSSAQPSVEFNNIPSTYSHLHMRVFIRSSRASSLDNLMIRFNNDTASNYYCHRLEGNGASIDIDGFGAASSVTAFLMPTAAETSNVFTGGYMDILDYTSTNKNKTYRNFYGFDANGSGYITLRSGFWFKTPEAITSIQLFSQNSANIVANSSFSLYGVK